MVRDAEATRRRLLDAAMEEFATRGIAGARVDRIARTAGSNKAQIYHYFGSKDALFDAVFDRVVQDTLRETPIDPTDLPEYAGRLFDRYQRHPEIQRLATWYRLERADSNDPIEAIVMSNAAKVKAIAEAQRAGQLSARFEPAVLLGLVLTISGAWSSMTPEYNGLVRRLSVAKRRQAIVGAVAALLVSAD
ncbi:MAG: TetR family transcriptional regulator [Solirubrobacteraceae bacterium]